MPSLARQKNAATPAVKNEIAETVICPLKPNAQKATMPIIAIIRQTTENFVSIINSGLF